MRSKSYLFLLLVVVLGLISGFVYKLRPYSLGLDIQGGTRITYQMDTSQLTPDQKKSMDQVRQRVVGLLYGRAQGALAVAEPLVAAKGDDQVIVELPGITDVDKAKETMGKSARIELYHATTVTTSTRTGLYDDLREGGKAEEGVQFSKIGLTDPIKPGTASYEAMIGGWTMILSGDDLASAQPTGSVDSPIIGLHFSPKGADKMREWTRRHNQTGDKIAFVLDKRVLNIAPLQKGAVISDEGVIQGTFSKQYVKEVCDLLNSGALPVDLKEIGTNTVSPTIGGEALQLIVKAGLIAFAVIAIFMLGYYAFPGVVAVVALSLYVLFTLSTLKAIGATFSLAGIAGFILSVGMAVDANILVFERFKEEIGLGKSLGAALELGFRRAFPAIVDSNACTILTSIVLATLGTGPVKGFATTLIIGVLISLFTAVTVTRSLLVFFVGSGIAKNPKWFAVDRTWFKRFDRKDAEPMRIVEKSGRWFLISAATVVISIPFFFMGGFKLNVEFKGGYESVFEKGSTSFNTAAIVSQLERSGFKGSNAKLATSRGKELVYVTVPPDARFDGKKDTESEKLIAESAGISDAKPIEFSKMSATLQAETIRNAILGVAVSSGLIILYLAFRFGIGFGGFAPGLRFGVSAIGALFHDILVVFGLAAVLGYFEHWEVSALFLTAMLTIIGFSVHDTIVIFDRIRENLHRPHGAEDFGHLIDRSITRSFTRSINTSMTVVVTLMILVGFGTATPDLKFFVCAMLFGIISGTYSSIYNASPILYLWDKAIAKRKGHEASLVGMAREESRHMAAATVAGTTIAVEPSQIITATPKTAAPTDATPRSTQDPQVVSKSGRSYGQVRRRASAKQEKPGWEELD